MNRLIKALGIELDVVSQREKLVSLAGGLITIGVLIFAVHRVFELPLGTGLIASMGASAVLLFAVPHGQLSQPWPVLAGHTIAAVIGVTCAKYLPGPELAAACAVGLSIWVMHQLKCIHPPGGATALVAVLGGDAVLDMGYQFVWLPVLANALIMVLIAVVFNYGFEWRRYPAGLCRFVRKRRGAKSEGRANHDDVVQALQRLDLFVDIAEDDLMKLVKEINSIRRLRMDSDDAPS